MARDNYNGYANWETWNVMLWLDNEEMAYNLYRRKRGLWTEETIRDLCVTIWGRYNPDEVDLTGKAIEWAEILEVVNTED